MKAKVEVETTMGILYFLAVNLPQKHTESVKITSGRKDATCSARNPSILAVIRRSITVISVVETRFRPWASSAVSSGRKASQGKNSAPVFSIFSRNSSKE